MKCMSSSNFVAAYCSPRNYGCWLSHCQGWCPKSLHPSHPSGPNPLPPHTPFEQGPAREAEQRECVRRPSASPTHHRGPSALNFSVSISFKRALGERSKQPPSAAIGKLPPTNRETHPPSAVLRWATIEGRRFIEGCRPHLLTCGFAQVVVFVQCFKV